MSKIYSFNNSLVQAGNNLLAGEPGGTGPTYIPGQYISIEDDVISVTGLQPEGDYATEADLQTVSAAIPEVAQADWAATGGPSEILNKPNFVGGENVTIAVSGDDVIINTTEMVSGMQVVAGDGIKLTASGSELIASVDETVLWSGTFSGSTGSGNYITLSEATTNFNTIEITMGGGYKTKLRYDGSSTTWQVFSPFVSSTYTGTVIYALMYTVTNNGTQVYCAGISLIRSSGWSASSSMNVGEVQLTKVVGIGRKST